MRSSRELLKVILRLLLLLGVVWLLIIGAAENNIGNGRKMKSGNMEINQIGREKHRAVSKFDDLNFTNKRRVPNGPDPIHNRRAGNSHRPPGRPS
ncbi:hypothetical protein BUALT_Bualt05G0153400 [Buddleja alternifolia]|uniref:CLAVATA3/ESR (CLE)-related protein 25 n=1 Tax=Buddleja alternifolia TaxID=168488 RepID=A0AAV6XSM9_9LAMI|nr:hypothetical protein BUALT_Bualt05G0153400 [Buddleja alternifolia]